MKKLLIFIVILITILILLSAQELKSGQNLTSHLTAQQFYDQIKFYKDTSGEFTLLDIRTKPEFEQGHISEAVMLDFYAPDFVEKLKQLDREGHYLIYCRSGNRTGQTIILMDHLGFKHVAHLKNGIISWVKAGFTLV
jgi:rhodanese-related sulfurtransferase